MVVEPALALLLFQGGDLVNSDQFHLIVIFVGVIAFVSFVQFLVIIGAAIGAFKVWKGVTKEINLVKQKAFPVVASVQGVVDDLRPKVSAITGHVQEIVAEAKPKVKTVTANVADISGVVKSKVEEFGATLDKANGTLRDVNAKTQAQVDRVDGMVSSALKATSDLSNTVHRGIRAPVMEVAGVVNGVKAALDVLVGRGKAEGMSTSKPGSVRSFGGNGGNAPVAGTDYRPGAGPVPVPPRGESRGFPNTDEVMSDPSSKVAPSPGAEEVLERYRATERSKP